MIFGDREVFAIEIGNWSDNLKEDLLLPLKIWLGSTPIGSFDDLTYIPTFIARLNHCLDNDVKLPKELEYKDTISKFNYLNHENTSSKYSLSLGDSFDCYDIYYYYIDDYIYFNWRLRDIFIKQDEETLNQIIFEYKVNKRDLLLVTVTFYRYWKCSTQ